MVKLANDSRRRLGVTFLLATMAALLTACAAATPEVTAPQKTITMKVPVALPEEDHQVRTIVSYLKDVEERTKKTSTSVTFELFPAGQLYNANQIPRAVIESAVEMGHMYATIIADQLIPAFNLLQAPLFWADEQHLQRSLEGEVGQILATEMEKQGAKVLWYNQLLSYEWWGRERPIVKPEDAKGLRLRSLGGIYDNFYAAIGGTTVNVPAGEQYSAFQRGIADGMVIDFGTVESRKLYEVLKYGTKGLRLRPGANAITINLDVWKSLPKDTQDAFLAAAKEASSREVDRVVPLYDELASFLESKGMQLHQATEAERKAWFAFGKMVEDDYLKMSGDLGRKVIEAARKYR